MVPEGTKTQAPDGPATTGLAAMPGLQVDATMGPSGPTDMSNVVAFAPRRERPHERLRAEKARQAVIDAMAQHRDSRTRLALAGHEFVADLRAGCDPALALAAFKRKADEA